MNKFLSLFFVISLYTMKISAQLDVQVVDQIYTRDPEQIETADMDLDGDMDLVIVSDVYGSGYDLSWYENAGNGLDYQPHTITSDRDIIKFQISDLDNDGDSDLVFIQDEYAENDSLILLSNEGGGTDFNSITLYNDETIDDFYVYDANDDGSGDIGIIASGDLVWIKNSGIWATWEINPVYSEPEELGSLTAGDFDKDGDMDLICFSHFAYQNVYYFKYADGAYTYEVFNVPGYYPGIRNLNSYDINNDGFPEVFFIYNTWPDAQFIMMENASGVFDPLENDTLQSAVGDFTFVDYDTDSDPDILFTTMKHYFYESEDFKILKNQEGTFPDTSFTVLLNPYSYIRGYAHADLNGDDIFDLVFSSDQNSYTDNIVMPALHDPDSLAFVIHNNISPKFTFFAEAVTLNLNADPYPEVISAYANGNINAYFYDTSLNSFGSGTRIDSIYSSCEYISNFFPIDLDNDGLDDYVANTVANMYSCSQVHVYINNGDSTFSETQTLSSEEQITACRFSDIDDDADADLIASFYDYDSDYDYVTVTLRIFLNTAGILTQALHLELEDVEYFRLLDVNDFDNDGDEDIFLFADDSLMLLKSNGGLDFSAPVGLMKIDSSFGVTFMNANADIYPDIVYIDINSRKMYLILDIDGVFSAPELVNGGKEGVYFSNLIPFDFNNDGREEIFSVNYNSVHYIYNDPVYGLTGQMKDLPIPENVRFCNVKADAMTDILAFDSDSIILLQNFIMDSSYTSSLTHINELSIAQHFLKISPNPGSGFFNIVLPADANLLSGKLYVKVFTPEGNEIAAEIDQLKSNSFRLLLPDNVKGMFFISVKCGSEDYKGKIIVQ